jgi:hypothetical protein
MGGLHILDENLTAETYTEFMEQSLVPYINQHFDDGNFFILHDGHPVHTSNHVKRWIEDNFGPVDDKVIPHPR